MEERKSEEICIERHAGIVSAREDFISKLPNALISQILLYLPTKDVVRTSGLSNRWKSVWLLIPELDLASNEFPDYNSFVSFMNRFLDISREEKPCLHKLQLSSRRDENDESCLTRWIDFVATRKLKHLDVECFAMDLRVYVEVMPLSLYHCEALLYLRLHGVSLGSFESISLPCLKTMSLELNVYANETCLEKFISSCPVLEDVSIVRREDDNVDVLRVHSQTLTSLSVGYDIDSVARKISDFFRRSTGLLIDAPRLEYLNFDYEQSGSKIIRNLGSLTKVKFACIFEIRHPSDGVGLSKIQMSRNLLTGISKVRDMIISDMTMEFFYDYSKVEPLPQFCNLSSLEATFCSFDLNILSTFLECCPNLKSIVLKLYIPEFATATSFSFVPRCLSSSLEFVEIKTRFVGRPFEFELARYFVQNSALLKKLILHFSCSIGVDLFLRDLHALDRLSSMCQIEHMI